MSKECSMESVNIVHLPDLHFGHPKVAAAMLHQHLVKYAYPEIKKCNLLTIGGDFFHDLIGLNSAAGLHAISVIDELIDMAVQYHFYIRIVRGTATHDRMQMHVFTRFEKLELYGKPLVNYFNTVSVETDIYGMNLLYVPDDMPYDNIMDHIYDAMKAVNVEKIDLVISHGYFKHLLPSGIPRIPKNMLDWDVMKEFVVGCVLNGHIHTPSIYEKVISGGSFERMVHGEEHDKGFFTINYNLKSHKTQFKFHLNPEAMFFKTIKLEEDTKEKNLEKYKNFIHDLMSKAKVEIPIHIRIVVDDQVLKQSLFEYTRNTFTDYKIFLTSIKPKDLGQYSAEEKIEFETADLPIITEENLPELMEKFIEERGDFTTTVDEIRRILAATANIRR